ncbi:MAG: hypothetical protein ACI89L_001926 [Phycisphaerales bacterium]|jgi:hypothetical protein
MRLLLVLSILLVPLIIIGTLAWWRIGDQWADNEHKRFKDKSAHTGRGPRVIAPFVAAPSTPEQPSPLAEPPTEN